MALHFLQKSARNAGNIDLPDQAIRLTCTPIASLSSRIVGGTQGLMYGAMHSSSLLEENNRLKRQLEGLKIYTDATSTYQKEVDSLRVEIGLDKTYQRQKVVGDILGYFPEQHRLTVGVGRDHGIKEGMPAVCASGIIGKVQTVGAKDCQVLLITSQAMQLGGIAEKYKPPAAGLVHGENSSALVMKFLTPEVPVSSGDIIVTSGFSDMIPKGIIIGRVLSAESLPEYGSSRARILPAVNVGELREVVILK